jgi:hypothetical protein
MALPNPDACTMKLCRHILLIATISTLASAFVATGASAELGSASAAVSPHQHASTPQPPVLPSPLSIPLDADTLATLPRETVSAVLNDRTLHCEGIPLVSLLRSADALPAQPIAGEALSRYVLVTARDGHRVLYSLAELEPSLGNHAVFLVDRCEGGPLDDEDGPLRLIAPHEFSDARWVRRVRWITVVTAP